jgi:hypothetical protein
MECMTECAQFVADGIANMTTDDLKDMVKWVDDHDDNDDTVNVTSTDDKGDQVVCDMDTQQEPEPVSDAELGVLGGDEGIPQAPDKLERVAQVAHDEAGEFEQQVGATGPLDQELEFLDVEWT